MTRISTGRVSGIETGGVTAYKGIPFARAPFGPLRFAAPEPAEPWDGVLEATRFGPRPPQPPMFMGMPAWDPAAGLDCLTVNVWTPDPGGSGLPVMVWIHGGAFRSGYADLPAYDGANLAGRGVVVVTFNHRIGFEGYGHVEGAPDNRALLDQVAALRWVRENVAAFGGDPGKVTVFGQSAGAAAIACLLRCRRPRACSGGPSRRACRPCSSPPPTPPASPPRSNGGSAAPRATARPRCWWRRGRTSPRR